MDRCNACKPIVNGVRGLGNIGMHQIVPATPIARATETRRASVSIVVVLLHAAVPWCPIH